MCHCTRAKPDATPLLVISPGANAHIGAPPGNEILGVVTQVCILESGVRYQVAWWDGRSRRCKWLEACEVRAVSEAARVPIGFVRG